MFSDVKENIYDKYNCTISNIKILSKSTYTGFGQFVRCVIQTDRELGEYTKSRMLRVGLKDVKNSFLNTTFLVENINNKNGKSYINVEGNYDDFMMFIRFYIIRNTENIEHVDINKLWEYEYISKFMGKLVLYGTGEKTYPVSTMKDILELTITLDEIPIKL